MVEQTTRYRVVVGSNQAGFWTFSPLLQILMMPSDRQTKIESKQFNNSKVMLCLCDVRAEVQRNYFTFRFEFTHEGTRRMKYLTAFLQAIKTVRGGFAKLVHLFRKC